MNSANHGAREVTLVCLMAEYKVKTNVSVLQRCPHICGAGRCFVFDDMVLFSGILQVSGVCAVGQVRITEHWNQ